MPAELSTFEGEIAKVRDHTVGVESEVPVGESSSYSATRFFNEIEIDLADPAMTLHVLSRWPDRLFLQNGDRILAAGAYEDGKFRVEALCNLTDGSGYLLVGSPSRRRELQRLLTPLRSGGDAEAWLSA